MTNPIRRRPGLNTETFGAGLILKDASGAEVARLEGERAALWSICDGETDATALALRVSRQTGMAIDADRLFDILDEFADDGLIVARVTPPATPAALGRRRFLSAALLGAGLVSAMTPVAMASNLANEEEKIKREGAHDARKNAQQAEKLQKQQERDAKHAA